MNAYLASYGALLARNEAMLTFLGCGLTDSDSLVEAEDRDYGVELSLLAHVPLVEVDPFVNATLVLVHGRCDECGEHATIRFVDDARRCGDFCFTCVR